MRLYAVKGYKLLKFKRDIWLDLSYSLKSYRMYYYIGPTKMPASKFYEYIKSTKDLAKRLTYDSKHIS